MVIIKDIHLKVSATMAQEKTKQDTLESYINTKVNSMNRKLNKVNTLFLDTLRYSNKTYFFEEVQSQKSKTESLQRQIVFLEKRQVLYKKQIELLQLRHGNPQSQNQSHASLTENKNPSAVAESQKQMDLAMKELEKQAMELDIQH